MAVPPVHMVVVVDPGRLDGDVEVDLLVDFFDPDVAVGVALYEQRPNLGRGLNLDDFRVLVNIHNSRDQEVCWSTLAAHNRQERVVGGRGCCATPR